ncbi:cyclin-dependent kinase 2-associated protein 1 isoform X1 [Tamandua tetradactyla]|uniref:cyclin-dependent kinase 2-associated protein 1 isoform X1 n=1 Tax=Tamandua tetradactyla TaxID=48850 RepID=UPI0040543212
MPRQAVLSQEEKQERDRLKKWRRREDGLKCGLERQCKALAMKCRRENGREHRQEREKERKDREAQRRLWERAEEPEEREKAWEAKKRRQQKKGEEQGTGNSQVPQSKYAELLAIIEELGKEIRPTYAGSKSAMERLKRGIIHARGLVRECLAETERNARS